MDVIQIHRERVGRRIRAARKSAGLSHDRLAAIVGTSRQHLIRLEKGIHAPRAEMLARIAEATDRDESFFASADDDEEPHPVSLDDLLRLRVREILRDEIGASRP